MKGAGTGISTSQVEISTGNLKHLVNLAKEAGTITPEQAEGYLRDITVLHFTATF